MRKCCKLSTKTSNAKILHLVLLQKAACFSKAQRKRRDRDDGVIRVHEKLQSAVGLKLRVSDFRWPCSKVLKSSGFDNFPLSGLIRRDKVRFNPMIRNYLLHSRTSLAYLIIELTHTLDKLFVISLLAQYGMSLYRQHFRKTF